MPLVAAAAAVSGAASGGTDTAAASDTPKMGLADWLRRELAPLASDWRAEGRLGNDGRKGEPLFEPRDPGVLGRRDEDGAEGGSAGLEAPSEGCCLSMCKPLGTVAASDVGCDVTAVRFVCMGSVSRDVADVSADGGAAAAGAAAGAGAGASTDGMEVISTASSPAISKSS